MPRSCSSAPRKKLPPPMTTAICAPVLTTAAICLATVSTTSGSTPTPPPPNISPPSLSSTRLYPERAPGSILRSVIPSGLADLEAGEVLHGDARGVQQGLHGLLGLLDRRLLQQHDVLVEAVDPTLDDARQHLLGLALLAGRGLRDAPLVLQHVARYVLAGAVLRPGGGDVHRYALGEPVVGAVVRHDRADGGRQVGRAAVQVERHRAVNVDVALELQLLADARREGQHGLLDGAAVERSGLQRSKVGGLLVDRDPQDLVGEGLEIGALRDEVGLAVQLDHRAALGRDEPVGRVAARALAHVLGPL